MAIVSLAEAREKGLQRYFTGKPCKNGHVCERLVSNKTCMKCSCERQNERYRTHGHIIRQRVRDYRLRNLEKVAAAAARKWRRDKAKLQKYHAARYRKKRDQISARVREYRRQRPGFGVAIGKAYLARKRQAMPSWVDQAEIFAIYKQADDMTKAMGVQYSVDHIYPLAGATSCGLHVPWNLQIITKLDNSRKGIKTPEEWAEFCRLMAAS